MAQYEIIIRQGESVESNEAKNNVAGDGKQTQGDKQIAKIKNQMVSSLKYVALNSTRELVVSKVGAYTRNNLLQQKIDAGFAIAGTITAFAVNPVLGAVTLATQVISKTMDYNLAVQQETTRLGALNQRAGYINRSRQ